jgi:hypothetical protein
MYDDEHLKQIFRNCTGFAEGIYVIAGSYYAEIEEFLLEDFNLTEFISFFDMEKSDELKV